MSAINTYTCPECGHRAVTVDVDEGTTPMIVPCRVLSETDCEGAGVSAWYRVPDGLTPEFEWYRPSKEEIAAASDYEQDHYELGGLALRRVDEPPASYVGAGEDANTGESA